MIACIGAATLVSGCGTSDLAEVGDGARIAPWHDDTGDDELAGEFPRPEFDGAVTGWIPDQPMLGKPPEDGTLIYHSCAHGDCSTKLLRPDGAERSLAEIHPEWAARLDGSGLAGASLSHDGKRLGMPSGSGYEIVNLNTGELVYEAEPGPDGTEWVVLEWSMGPFAAGATLAQVRDGRTIAYAAAAPSGDGQFYTPNLVGVVAVPGSSWLSEPLVDVEARPSDRSLVRHFQSPSAYIDEVMDFDYSDKLRGDETLAGPAGVMEWMGHPGPMVGSAINWGGTKVFVATDDEVMVAAVLLSDFAPGENLGDRLEVPLSTDEERWELLGLINSGVAVARVPVGGDRLDVVAITPHGQELLHTLPADAEVLIPGAVRPSAD